MEGRRTQSSNPWWKREREENSLAAELPWPEGSLYIHINLLWAFSVAHFNAMYPICMHLLLKVFQQCHQATRTLSSYQLRNPTDILTRGVELGHVASRTSPVPNWHVLRRTTTEELTFVFFGPLLVFWSNILHLLRFTGEGRSIFTMSSIHMSHPKHEVITHYVWFRARDDNKQ